MEKRSKTIPEDILVEILARLPMKAIARFKSVSKTWNSQTASPYFRRRFFSVNTNSSSTWSLMFISKFNRPITEAIGFHGRDTWDLPNSLSSYILSFQPYPNLPTVNYYYVASSNGLVWIEVFLGHHHNRISFVGNPVSKHWVEIPPPPSKCAATGLVTRVENGVVTSFKVVRTCSNQTKSVWRVYVYSSETGLWSFKKLRSFCPVHGSDPPVNIDGKLYLWEKDTRDGCKWEKNDRKDFGFLVAYDFYGDEDHCQVVAFPFPDNKYVRRCLTTSRGDVIYVEILYRRLKVWKLSSNESELLWELSREEINLASVGFDVFCFPLAMNPFDGDIIYLWSREHDCLVTGNLHTLEFVVHRESENWSSSDGGCCCVNKYDSKMYMEGFRNGTATSVVVLSQFVLPPWMDLVPRPPHTR